jgi:hypothetical protein
MGIISWLVAALSSLWILQVQSFQHTLHHNVLRLRYEHIQQRSYRYVPESTASPKTDIKATVSLPDIDRFKSTSSIKKLFKSFSTRARTTFFAIVAIITGLRMRMFRTLNNGMESGWKKRGSGGSFARTVEVWSFAIQFLFKYVRIPAHINFISSLMSIFSGMCVVIDRYQ